MIDKIEPKDFAYLFMWGIQFDTEMCRIASNPKKSWKGTYWTRAIMAFLDRLGTKLGFETDVEKRVILQSETQSKKGGNKLDMLWSKDKPFPFHVFIEHEGSLESNIPIAIKRLNGQLENGEQANLKVLITYAKKNNKYYQMLEEFTEPAKTQNLVIWYPMGSKGDWPKPSSSARVDLTKFQVLPRDIEDELHKATPIYRLFGAK